MNYRTSSIEFTYIIHGELKNDSETTFPPILTWELEDFEFGFIGKGGGGISKIAGGPLVGGWKIRITGEMHVP